MATQQYKDKNWLIGQYKKFTTSEIALFCGVSSSGIKYYFKKFNIKTPRFSDRQRQNMSIASMGNTSHLGFKHTNKTKKKIGEKKIGIPLVRTESGKASFRKKMSGANNPNWNGGSSRAYKDGYYSNEYRDWRTSVFKRDNYICQECGDDNYITAHHIKSFAKYPELRFNINNGLTLCPLCHSKTDNYKGRCRG